MAGETKIVIDASVAVKWFNPEQFSAEALELRELHVNDEIHLLAPELLLYEITNALKWNPEFTKEDVMAASRSLVELMITYKNIELEESILLAYKYDITIYDSAYIALAKKYKTTLVTADDKLKKLAGGEKCIISIKDYLMCKN